MSTRASLGAPAPPPRICRSAARIGSIVAIAVPILPQRLQAAEPGRVSIFASPTGGAGNTGRDYRHPVGLPQAQTLARRLIALGIAPTVYLEGGGCRRL